MRRSFILFLATALALGCSKSTSAPDTSVPRGTWGSGDASLTLTDSSSTLWLLRSGCIGAYGTVSQPITTASFSLPGTYTQLMGAYPGKTDYPAQFTGSVANHEMSVTITVPSLQQDFGPFGLSYGVTNNWTMCLYP